MSLVALEPLVREELDRCRAAHEALPDDWQTIEAERRLQAQIEESLLDAYVLAEDWFGEVYALQYLTHELRAIAGPAAAAAVPAVRRRKAIPAAVRRAVFERDAYRCRTCGSWQNLQLDHVVPWSKGGSDDEPNLQTLCGPCNNAKGAR